MRITDPGGTGGGGGTGTVTSITMPVTEFSVASPTTAAVVTWINQAANTFMGGPATGAPAVPGFRTLVAADLPAIAVTDSWTHVAGIVKLTTITDKVGIGTATPGQLLEVSGAAAGGSNLYVRNTSNAGFASLATLNDASTNYNQFITFGTAYAGTRYGLTAAGLNEFTAHGVLALGTDNASAFYIVTNNAVRLSVSTSGAQGWYGSTSGILTHSAAAVTTSYAIVWPAAQGGASTVLTNDGAGNLSWGAGGAGAVSSVFGRTGAVVAVAGDYGPTLGGTGQTTVTTGDLLYGSAANVWSKLAAGTLNYVLTSGGPGTAPSRAPSAGGGGTWAVYALTTAAGVIAIPANLLIPGTTGQATVTGNVVLGAPTGGASGDRLSIELTSATTAFTLTAWNAVYAAGAGIPLPSALTGGGVVDRFLFGYNDVSAKWDLLSTSIGSYFTGALIPNVDSTAPGYDIGTASLRWKNEYLGGSLKILNAAGDAQPKAELTGAGLYLGAGGASAADWSLVRTGAAAATLTGSVYPDGDVTRFLGDGTHRFSGLAVQDIFKRNPYENDTACMRLTQDGGGYGVMYVMPSGLNHAYIYGDRYGMWFSNLGSNNYNIVAGAALYFDASAVATAGDSGFSKSAASGGNFSTFYDATETQRDDGTNLRVLSGRRMGSYKAIADTNPLAAFSGTMCSVSATKTIANSLIETTLFGTEVGTKTLAASADLRVGSIIRVGARGFYSCLTGVPGNVTVNVKIGTLVVATATFAGTSAAANQFFGVACDIRIQATGAAGTVWAQGDLDVAVAGVITRIPLVTTAVSAAIDFTATKVIDITWTWATNDAANTVTSTNPFIEVLP